MQGRWDQRHHDHILAMDCDIILLTEVSERADLANMTLQPSAMLMAPHRRWAAVASRRPMSAVADPHGAAAMANIEDLRVCSSILPWRACGTRNPWIGATTAERTAAAITRIEAAAPNVWGGDWNHAMSGREWSGSVQGRRHITDALDRLELQLPTADSPHQIKGLLSIDHIAVPNSWTVMTVEHHPAWSKAVRISDHDAYVVKVDPGDA